MFAKARRKDTQAAVKRVAIASLVAAGLVAAAMGGAALGAEPVKIETFKYWTAWTGSDASGATCYISSQPQDLQPGNVDHGDNHFLIIHRKGLGTKNEVQALAGYTLNAGADEAPTATVDGRAFNMIVEGSAAWLASAQDEGTFVEAMKKGSTLVVKMVSQRGTNTTYTYSLGGVTAAMAAIDSACN